MSKTFYAEGQTGKVAIMEGAFNQAVIDNPEANTDKLYFHSDFNYLKYVGEVTGSATFPYLGGKASTGYFSNTSVTIGSLAWEYTTPPIIFTTIDSVDACGEILKQKNSNQSFRFVSCRQTLTSGTLTLQLFEFALSMLATLSSVTVSATVKIFTPTSTISGTTGISITPSSCVFNNGKFNSSNIYAKANSSGFALSQGAQISLVNYGFTFASSTSVGVEV